MTQLALCIVLFQSYKTRTTRYCFEAIRSLVDVYNSSALLPYSANRTNSTALVFMPWYY